MARQSNSKFSTEFQAHLLPEGPVTHRESHLLDIIGKTLQNRLLHSRNAHCVERAADVKSGQIRLLAHECGVVGNVDAVNPELIPVERTSETAGKKGRPGSFGVLRVCEA